jgi:hypothetical protein
VALVAVGESETQWTAYNLGLRSGYKGVRIYAGNVRRLMYERYRDRDRKQGVDEEEGMEHHRRKCILR